MQNFSFWAFIKIFNTVKLMRSMSGKFSKVNVSDYGLDNVLKASCGFESFKNHKNVCRTSPNVSVVLECGEIEQIAIFVDLS